jgi:hypothetical protein
LIYKEDRVLLFATVSVWGLTPIQQALSAAFLKVMQLTCNFNHYPQVPKVKNYWNCTSQKRKPSLIIRCAENVPLQTNHAPRNCSIINQPTPHIK